MPAPLLLSFTGVSGAGKTTSFSVAKEHLMEKGYIVKRCDVAEPLREAQQAVYKVMGLEDPGDPFVPETFTQDPHLLSTLASLFFPQLDLLFSKRLMAILKRYETVPKLAIINTDCRDNMFPKLRKHMFRFILVHIPTQLQAERLQNRGDIQRPAYEVPLSLGEGPDRTLMARTDSDYWVDNSGSLESLRLRVKSVLAIEAV